MIIIIDKHQYNNISIMNVSILRMIEKVCVIRNIRIDIAEFLLPTYTTTELLARQWGYQAAGSSHGPWSDQTFCEQSADIHAPNYFSSYVGSRTMGSCVVIVFLNWLCLCFRDVQIWAMGCP